MWQWPDEQPNPMDVEKEIDRVLSLVPMKSALLDQIPEEPHIFDPWSIILSIQLPEPSGRLLQRGFLLSHSLKYLHYYVLIQQDAPTNFDVFIKDTELRVPCQPTREDPDPPTFGEFGLWNGAELVVYDSDYGGQ
ncbi:FAS-associated factor 2-like isoform X1 [Rhipicephalus microplus]|uniref:FAS-associated factor 2-like isoform X1 n=2 Tax=Rhipicephalus microplus TaxID=6941 RepID=UPI003F6B23E8